MAGEIDGQVYALEPVEENAFPPVPATSVYPTRSVRPLRNSSRGVDRIRDAENGNSRASATFP